MKESIELVIQLLPFLNCAGMSCLHRSYPRRLQLLVPLVRYFARPSVLHQCCNGGFLLDSAPPRLNEMGTKSPQFLRKSP